MSAKAGDTVLGRVCLADEKPQHILDSAVTHRQCDGSYFALLSGMLRNFASRKYCGFGNVVVTRSSCMSPLVPFTGA